MAAEKAFVIVTGAKWLPFGDWKILDNGEKTFAGPLKNLLDALKQYIQFEYELITPPDKLWGYILPNGSWTGMLGQLLRKEAEISMGPFVMTPERSTVCDFTVPLVHESWTIMTPRPILESDVSGFLKPFTAQVWLLILASLLSVGTAMACVVWFEGKIFNLATKNIVSKAITWVLLTLSQEGSDWLPKKDGGRLIVTTWLLASLVFMTSYSGILTAMLTLPRVTITIDSLADLVSQSAFPWHIEDGSILLKFLQGSTNELHQKAFKGRTPVQFRDRGHVLQRVLDRQLVSFGSEITIRNGFDLDFSSSGQCHLYITREEVMSNTMMSLAVRKNSTYLAKANHVVRVVLESGLWNKWLGEELTNSSHCLRHPKLDRRGDGIQPLDIESFTGPLFVLFGGSTLGCTVFLCECLKHYILKPSWTSALITQDME